jgi:hypothetical protein
MAKTIVVAALTLLLGIFIGGIGPRAELARARTELAAAQAKAKRGSDAALPLALGLGSLAAARRAAEARADAEQEGQGAVRRVPRFNPPETPAPDPEEAAGAARPDAGHKNPLHDKEAFAAAKTAQDLRAAQFRAAFVEKAQLSSAGVAALDASIKQMNDELAQVAVEVESRWTRMLETREKPRPRDFADVGARVLEAYRKADDRFTSALDDRAKGAIGASEFDLLTQIDLGSFERLTGIISRLEDVE